MNLQRKMTRRSWPRRLPRLPSLSDLPGLRRRRRVEARGAGCEGDVRRLRLDALQPALGLLPVRLRRLHRLLQVNCFVSLY